MNSDITGFILSYVLIVVVVGITMVIQKLTGLDSRSARKLIHIGVSNWWFLAAYYFTGPLFPMIGSVTFIAANLVLTRVDLVPGFKTEPGENNLGTVYFPVALLILSYLCFTGYTSLSVGAAAVVVLGYGDGLAALTGMHLGKHTLINNRTVEGFTAMALFAFLALVAVAKIYGDPVTLLPFAGIALAAAIVELVTPRGLDNLSIPAVTGLLYHLLITAA